MIRIIGIGSPFGDDAAGLEAARQLAADPPPDTDVVVADRPGAALIDLFDDATALILIDAAHSSAPPGTLHDIDLHSLPTHPLPLVSSHDLGVLEVVQLAATLGRLPRLGRVIGIEVGAESCGERMGLSADVRSTVAKAATRALRWCATYSRSLQAMRGSLQAAPHCLSK